MTKRIGDVLTSREWREATRRLADAAEWAAIAATRVRRAWDNRTPR